MERENDVVGEVSRNEKDRAGGELAQKFIYKSGRLNVGIINHPMLGGKDHLWFAARTFRPSQAGW